MKRLFDIFASATGLVVLSPVLLVIIFLIWVHDRHSPFYFGRRVGKNHKIFRMVKLRSMVVNADKSGVSSTAEGDKRITPIGHVIRAYKLDEFMQLWNVLKGDMSLVGPRPQTLEGIEQYTNAEKTLLDVQPGITDLSSVIFSDEGKILKDSEDTDRDYDLLIRPWKSRLGLLYIDNRSMLMDFQLILLTIIAIVSKSMAHKMIDHLLEKINASLEIRTICKRESPLTDHLPPETNEDLYVRKNIAISGQ